MAEALLAAGVAAAAFVSTSLDNLLLLIGLLAGGRVRGRDAALGYVGSVAIVLAVASVGSAAAELATDAWLRWLGLLPLAMGLRRWLLAAPEEEGAAAGGPPRGVLPVLGVMLANSGDSLVVFASLLGETRASLLPVAVATSLALALGWAALARAAVAHAAVAPALRRLEPVVVPPLLVAIGLYILTDTPTDTET